MLEIARNIKKKYIEIIRNSIIYVFLFFFPFALALLVYKYIYMLKALTLCL